MPDINGVIAQLSRLETECLDAREIAEIAREAITVLEGIASAAPASGQTLANEPPSQFANKDASVEVLELACQYLTRKGVNQWKGTSSQVLQFASAVCVFAQRLSRLKRSNTPVQL